MPELIDRYATMGAIPAPTDADEAEYYGKICDAIEAMPTIKSEARRGRWIPTEYDSFADGAPVWDKWECSECGHEHSGEEDTLTAFCPDCGADMREGGADNG